MRRAIINRLMEARFPVAHLKFSGGDDADERAAEEMRRAAAAEQSRLEALSKAELDLEMEFAGLAATQIPVGAADRPTAQITAERRFGPKVGAAVDALRARHGDSMPKGFSEKTMLSALNADLKAQGKDSVSEETLKRAKKALWSH